MRAGRLRKRVELQSRAVAKDDIGGTAGAWGTDATVWASIVPTGGQERYSNNKESAEVTHKIKIRNYAALTAAHRIKFGTRIFDIQYINDLQERGADVEIMAIEQVQ